MTLEPKKIKCHYFHFPPFYLPWSEAPVTPKVSLSHQEASTSLLSSPIRGQTERKPQTQKTNQTDHIYQLYFHILFHTGYYRILNRILCADKMRSTGEGYGKSLQYSCLENPMNSMEKQKGHWKMNSPGCLVGAQYATGDQWRNHCRKNEEMEPKQKQQ